MSDRRWQERVREQLDRTNTSLDPDIARRLQTARAHALSHERSARPWRWGLPAAGLATAAAAGLALLLNLSDTTTPPPDALELVTVEEDLQMVRELDFYIWLEEEDLAFEPQQG